MPGRRSMTQRAAAGIVLVAALVASACTGERPELAAEADATTSSTEATTTTEVDRGVEVAEAEGETIDVFADATSDEPQQQLTAASVTSAPGIPIVFLVKDRDDDRVEVYLPTEPPGSTGWVRASDVSLSGVDHRIEVEVSTLRLRVYDGDELVVDEPAGVGPDQPAASDGLFLRELVQPPDDDGPYGSYAYGLSGFPPVRAGLEDGDGVVGIHGTDDPDLIGSAMPTGSIAIAAEALARLVDDIGLPLGTPVEIIA